MAHGEFLRQHSENPELASHVIHDYRNADWDPQTRAMLDYAYKLTKEPESVHHDDFEGLKEIGPVSMRLELKQGINRTLIIDDTYNNDLAGLRMALDFMNGHKQKDKKTLILSDILQTGMEEKKLYQDENFEAIARVIEAERAEEDVARRDQEVQEAWSTWREDERGFARKVSAAQTDLDDESRIAQASTYDPANPLNVAEFEGELVSKDVTVTATVTKDGVEEERTMVITLQKVELQGGEAGLIDGRWIITSLE